jgi:DNA (cytosine-5)-methyltransferase 1
VLFVKGRTIKARLLSTREVTLLMGLEAGYKMPERYNQAYHVAGDGVAVPIVRYLDAQLFQPILKAAQKRQAA